MSLDVLYLRLTNLHTWPALHCVKLSNNSVAQQRKGITEKYPFIISSFTDNRTHNHFCRRKTARRKFTSSIHADLVF